MQDYNDYISDELLDNYKKAVDMSTILSITDAHGVILYANDLFCNISGYSRDELIGRSHNIVRHPNTPKAVFADLWKTIKAKKTWRGIIQNRAKNGRSYTVKATIFPVLDKYGNIREIIGIRHDITDQVDQAHVLEDGINEQKILLDNIRMFDASTGLPNHLSLIEFLDSKKDMPFSVLALKIDNLKSIKDTLGGEFAEAYMNNLTHTLNGYTLHVDGFVGIYRVYFDELVLIFEGRKTVYEKLAHEFSHMSRYLFVTHNNISVGSVFTIVLLNGTEAIYEKTLAALIFAFDEHRGEVFRATPSSKCFEDKVPTNIYWFSKYSHAIENDDMVPFYQPILSNETGKIEKFECLARIKNEAEIISPDKFVSLASKAKQIPFLTKAIVRKAFEHFADKEEFDFSINVSSMDLQDQSLFKHIMYWQEKTKIDPSRMVLEILESEDIYKYHVLKNSVEQYKKEGFKIAIDDFGTGYSNFIALYEYNVDFIKIDGSFIKDLDVNPQKHELVTHLHQLINMCGAKSVAEFVSNDKIQEIVKGLGVNYSQGYAIGIPHASVNGFMGLV